MGPFPHDAQPAAITDENPAGTNGFEFVEFAHPDPEVLKAHFTSMGFSPVARHKSKNITVWRQGDVNYLLNEEPGSFGSRFMRLHGPSAPSMAWRVADAGHAYAHALSKGAKAYDGPGKSIDAPAILGIGGSLLYFIEQSDGGASPYDNEFRWLNERNPAPQGAGLYYIDHLTHNVQRGNMDTWFGFYADLFNFRQIRFFDIEGRHTGLFSRALTSPCGRIRIPINESADEHSQIEEYLHAYKGEGIQHIACGCRDIYSSVARLRANGLKFMPAPPATYYEGIEQRLAGHGEAVQKLQELGILIDGEGVVEGGLTKVLLQIFSATVVGPIFFEFIQRKGDEGFGEGNFKALFESIEEDQIRRGILKVDAA